MYRYLSPVHYNFDTRAESLKRPSSSWDEAVKQHHEKSRTATIEGLRVQYGSDQLDSKVKAFQDFGPMPMSVVFEHTPRVWQIRDAFVAGAYYPALTAACSIGEKILNHMILHLRGHYPNQTKKMSVYEAGSITNWHTAIQALEDWAVLRKGVGTAFRKLSAIRNRTLHVDPRKTKNDQSEALSAIQLLKQILEDQFGTWGHHEWFIRGTTGLIFISRAWERHPFVLTYYLANTVSVSPYFKMIYQPNGLWAVIDRADLPPADTVSDEDFCQAFNDRKPDDLAADTAPMGANLRAFILVPGQRPLPATLEAGPNGIVVVAMKARR